MKKILKMVKQRPFLFFIAPGALLYLVLIIYPMFSTFVNSFCQWDGIGEKLFIGFSNFKMLFTDSIYAPQFLNALKNSFIFVLLCYIIQVPLAFYFAYVINRKVFLSKTCQLLIFMPQVISQVAVGLLVLLFLDPNFGVVNNGLRAIGLGSWARGWLGDPVILKLVVAVILTWKGIGIPMMLLIANMQSIPAEYEEAASLDGANEWNKFRYITLPLLKPALTNIIVLIFINGIATFDIPYLLGGMNGGPSGAIDTLGTMFYRVAFGSKYLTNNMGLATAIAVIQFLIMVTVSVIQISLLKRNETEY